MKSPVRFIMRGLAEGQWDETGCSSSLRYKGKKRLALVLRAGLRRQRRRRLQRARWLPPGAGIAARDHPVDHARDDARAGHDFEMPPDDAFEVQRRRIKRNQAEITGEPDHAAADCIG